MPLVPCIKKVIVRLLQELIWLSDLNADQSVGDFLQHMPVPPAVHCNSAKKGFHHILYGWNVFCLTGSVQYIFVQPQQSSPGSKMFFIYELAPDLCHLSFGIPALKRRIRMDCNDIWELLGHLSRDDHIQDCVSQKFQLFAVSDSIYSSERPSRKGLPHQVLINEFIPDCVPYDWYGVRSWSRYLNEIYMFC